MKIFELEKKLEELCMSDDTCYSLSKDYINEGYILKKKYIIWEIYYCEKGEKNYIKKFWNESKACDFFYNLIKDLIN